MAEIVRNRFDRDKKREKRQREKAGDVTEK
jgi:hypothetical protein